MNEEIGELSEDEEELIRSSRAGRSIICNCNFGFMVTVQTDSDGRMRIECPKQAIPVFGHAEAAHVRAALKSWDAALRQYDADKGEA